MPVANRRFERFEYRQVLTRMRLCDTERAIARAGLMVRRKSAQLHRTAEAADCLDVATALSGDGELSVHLGSVRTQPTVASLAEPHRERITRWWRQGIQGTTIHSALVRSHGFTGSYSSVRRFHAFARMPLLVIDDFGLKPLRAPQDEDFHELVAERYERGAIIAYVIWNMTVGGLIHALPTARVPT